MDIDGIKKNILPINNEIIKKEDKPASKTEKEEGELVSSEASLASRAYGLSKISNSTDSDSPIGEFLAKHRPDMPRKIRDDILSKVSEENFRLSKILISDEDIKDGMIKEVLETTDFMNEYLRIQTYNFLKEHKEDFGNNFSYATAITLKYIHDDNAYYQLPSFFERAKNECRGNSFLLSRIIGSFAFSAENAEYLLNTFINNREKFGSDSGENILLALYEKDFLFAGNTMEGFNLNTYLQDENLYNNEALKELIIPIITTDPLKDKDKSLTFIINKIDLMKYISKSDFDVEEIRKLKKEGFTPYFERLQDTGRYDIVFRKTSEELIDNNQIINKKSEAANLYETEDVVRLTPDGQIIKSELKRFDFGLGKTLERTTTSDGKYSCDSYYKSGETSNILTKEIRVVNGKNGPLYVQKTVASPIMEGVYDTTVYNLAQTDKKIDEVLEAIKSEGVEKGSDILEKIEKAGVKGWNFSRTVENPDGTKSHIEKFQRGEYHTKRKYTKNDDETKTSLDYTISDTRGRKLLNLHRTFELKGNKSISTLNGKEYIAEFDDDKMTVTIEGKEINFKEKMKDMEPEKKELLWNLIKKTPADLILKLKNVENFKYETGNGHWSHKENRISSDNDLGTLSHEIGHLIDDNFKKSEERYIISNDPELIKIYNEEMEDFKRNISEEEALNIKYFSQTGGSAGTGLSELVAEVNMLCSTQKNLDLQTRSLYLTRYFPKTSAKAAELLGY